MENKRYIIRECGEPELSYYFDGDCFNEHSGDYNNTLFIVSYDRWGRYDGLNIQEYKRIMEEAEAIVDGFNDVEDGLKDYDGNKITYKEVMQENGWKYSATACHKLKEWWKQDENDPDAIAQYLTIKTGKKWKSIGVCGYCQGDHVDVVYCPDNNTDKTARICGEVWLGCAKEFGVIELDEDGNETDSVYGFIVADCEAREDEDYKRIVCEEYGIDKTEAVLEIIDGYTTITHANYRTA